ncbi:Hypothetical protein mma_3029 [Janthinobacterium sp. Marseille]|uniref:Helix-turn-helix domain-containing protein n=1 Tax=Herminiimonas aquatilis TaxID=345342 RepID=A0ABW2J8D5_9BURK|nr:helix-turn-helix transcriptional regulator [Janthinobacterium sp. Marseille]ABR91872.1 Hypothetical protein mma_3029 [Janthinobacterium sp. Marseille]MBX9798566.1 helix-turn-helix transcriptional regulator [Burkholderiaceae bacterium]
MDIDIEPKDVVRSAWLHSGDSQANFAKSLTKSQSMLSKYIAGKVPPPASVLIHCMNICGLIEPKSVSAADLASRICKELQGLEHTGTRNAINQLIDSISSHNRQIATPK